jgi:UDP-N-acetylglucosamine--N-acetylmuramyl-(pentapeptide) pyrophosphoryl-undecaprenol N-acetylglucosamine transferase
VIGYYVHHHGRGHLNRALSICAQLEEPVVFLSSLPRPRELRDGDLWVRLPMDLPDPDTAPADATARGRLHWAPLHVDGLARRSADLLQTLATTRARRLVVDVSVEISVLARLSGVPVTVMAMPGDRTDAAHRLAYDLADSIIAPWSAEVHRPDSLTEHGERTHFVGAISRFDGANRSREASPQRPVALLLAGAGGTEIPADALDQLRSALPHYRWVAAGGAAAWIDDLWPTLTAAELVITHAGQNAIADIALCEKAAIVLPQQRPFGEQHATAQALADAGIAVVAEAWPRIEEWPALAAEAVSLDVGRWTAMEVRGAAARAAAVIAA